MSRIADYAKFITDTVVVFGTGKVVSGVIKNNVEVETTVDKITVGAASYAISGAVASQSSKYTDEIIDNIDELALKAFAKHQEPKKD